MLASICESKSLPYTILEADANRHARTQGGSLDIHADSGQMALSEAGLLDSFKSKMRIEGQAIKICDLQGNKLFETTEGFSSRPEIDRIVLRDMLLDSLNPEKIRWGSKVICVEATKEVGYHDIHLADGDVLKGFNVVVGADGAWSKVRPLLSDVKPFYSGICGLDIWTHNVDTRKPELSALVGQGACFTFGDKRALMGQRNGGDTVRIYAFVSEPESWSGNCGIN